MRFLLPTALLAATALAGHSSAPKHKAPGMLLTGCPNGYTDIMTGECKPYHLRMRDAKTGDWRSHRVTNAYPVAGGHGWFGKGKGGKGWDGKGKGGPWHAGPNEHCPNGVANHGTGECRPFKIHARDAEKGKWRVHTVTGMYRIPDEKPGRPGFRGKGGKPVGGMPAGKAPSGFFGGKGPAGHPGRPGQGERPW